MTHENIKFPFTCYNPSLSRLYKMAVAFMLAHPYGFTRVMSSYRWDRNIVNGQVDV